MFAWPCNAAKMVVDGLDSGPSLPIITRGTKSIRGFVNGFFLAGHTCLWVTKLIGYNIAIDVVK